MQIAKLTVLDQCETVVGRVTVEMDQIRMMKSGHQPVFFFEPISVRIEKETTVPEKKSIETLTGGCRRYC